VDDRHGSERLLATFLEAVRIDSPSGEEAAFGAWCAERLKGLGATARFDDSSRATGSDTGNLIAEVPGDREGAVLVLSAHLDTVEPGRGIAPAVDGGVVRSSGGTVLGADDKAGVAAILEALARVAEQARPHAPLRVVLTVQEEKGLVGAKALADADIRGDLCLVLDAHGPVGRIIISAPTHHTFTATFEGVSAHAGVEPERGISAVAMAASAVCAMRLGRLDEETTANVGEVRGGGETNVVAASCLLTGECRSRDPEQAERIRLEMDEEMRLAARSAGGSVRIDWVKQYDGYRLAPDDERVALVERACAVAGVEPSLVVTGGGSDGSVLTARGLPSVVLSCGMTDVHSTQESVAVTDLDAMVRVLLAAIDLAVSS